MGAQVVHEALSSIPNFIHLKFRHGSQQSDKPNNKDKPLVYPRLASLFTTNLMSRPPVKLFSGRKANSDQSLARHLSLFRAFCYMAVIIWSVTLIRDRTDSVFLSSRLLFNNHSASLLSNQHLATCPAMTAKRKVLSQVENQEQSDIRDTVALQEKPTFVLHVGLPKTGTTFLQCALTAHANVTVPILMMNQYEFMGVGPYTSERNNPCHQIQYDEQFIRMSKSAVFDQEKDWIINVDFRKRVRELHERGNHGILIFEYAFRYNDQHLGKLADLLNPWFNVEVVVAYRPYFMWLPSMYNQVAKAGLTSSYWPDQTRDDRKNKRIKVPAPDALGFDLEDRPAFVKSYLTVFERSRQHPAAVTKSFYQKYFPQVHLFPTELGPSRPAPTPPRTKESASSISGSGSRNIIEMSTRVHKQVDPMLEHFFCCLVPDAPHACQAIRAGLWDFDNSGSNPSESLDEDILAVAAYKANYVPPGVTRTVVRRVVADHVKELQQRQSNKKAAPYSLQCWSPDKLNRLEQLSLNMELSLFDGNNQWTKDLRRLDESVHHQLFLQAVAKQKFCSVDVERTLEDWKTFFQSKEYVQQLLSYTVREANGEDLVLTS